MHFAAVHTNPALHAVAAQHGWPAPPHGSGGGGGGMGLQLLISQRSPSLHDVPLQQSSPSPPHRTGGTHSPRRHSSVAAHSDEGVVQHATPSAPHADASTPGPKMPSVEVVSEQAVSSAASASNRTGML
jgi:hypothetical protein